MFNKLKTFRAKKNLSQNTKIVGSLGILFGLLLVSPWVIAVPSLSILPKDYTYHDQSIALGSTHIISYEVTNNTNKTLYNLRAQYLPDGMTSSVCSPLSPQNSCTLKLRLPSKRTLKPRNINRAFKICARGLPDRCTRVQPEYQLQLTIGNSLTFLALTDIHLSAGKATPITYGQDTNDALWSSTRTQLGKLIKEQLPQFMLLLGDLPAHRDRPNLENNIGTVLRDISGLSEISSSNLPVFFVFGNNDSLHVNYGPFSQDSNNLFGLDSAHNSPENKGWPALNANPDCRVSPKTACTYTTTTPMPEDHAEDMAYAQTQGFYSAYPLGKIYPLRFISLNSIIFSHEYYLTGTDQLTAAQVQMDWLEKQLASARKNKEAVYIAMHIPVGNDAFHHGADMWNDTLLLTNGLGFRDAFLTLMSEYKSTVRAVITGHTHLHELRALYSDKSLSNVSVLGVGVPGITPNHYNNPGMQVYLYDDQYQLNEVKTFFTTPDVSDWKSYSFQYDFGCEKNSTMLQCIATSLLPKLPSWELESQRMENNPYQKDYSVRAPNFDPTKGDYSSWPSILEAIQVVPTK